MISRLHREDTGVSLVELLVVMVIMAVVGTTVVNAVVTGARAQTTLENRVTALTDLQKAVERVSQRVRASDARTTTARFRTLREAAPNRVVTEVYQGANRIQSTYFTETVSGRTRLCEYRVVQPATNTPPVPPATPTCDARQVDDITSAAIFSFQNISGSPVSGADPSVVKRVEISIARNVKDAAPIQVSTVVQLRNGQ